MFAFQSWYFQLATQALHLFKTMTAWQLEPNLFSFNAAISSCEQQGQWQQGISLYLAMLQGSVAPDACWRFQFANSFLQIEKPLNWGTLK